jgi:hypothetical protein
MNTVTVQRLIGASPFMPTPDTAVFNAPRPMYGTEYQKGFAHGVFYGVVNLNDELTAEAFVKRNLELDGYLTLWVSNAEVEAWFKTYQAKYPDMNWADLPNLVDDTEQYIHQQYLGECGRVVIGLDMTKPLVPQIRALLVHA